MTVLVDVAERSVPPEKMALGLVMRIVAGRGCLRSVNEAKSGSGAGGSKEAVCVRLLTL